MSSWHVLLGEAVHHASHGRFADVSLTCRGILSKHGGDIAACLDVGSLLLSCGLITEAEACFRTAQDLDRADLRPTANLANVCQQKGDHRRSRRLYDDLLRALPDNPAVRRSALTNLEYDGDAGDQERLSAAAAWGAWAERRAAGPRLRPPIQPLRGRPLRVGYVSADICQHTVGLFAKDVLAAHDPGRVTTVVYSAGQVSDWVTDAVRSATAFRDVRQLDDQALAGLIGGDAIDVLVDLSGHTAGSRLTAFAYRPAPVMVSWLGYFATTGLPCMDAVLLDQWHAPVGTERFFTEPIIRMPHGRLCYTPVPFAPAVAPSPHATKGVITFGSFNNTAKLSSDVLALWARVLHAVPSSRLVLKWRTFNDEPFRRHVWQTFQSHGIDSSRVDLRGPSFHADMLAEYGNIDIALDPFPFTGGLTSCEALWMGVPVVTWPQSRVVSRQTFAFLSQIGLERLAARDAEDYIAIAAALAADGEGLKALRQSLRGLMSTSPLCDVARFTRGLEDTCEQLFRKLAA